MDFCLKIQKIWIFAAGGRIRVKKMQKNMDFCRRRQNKDEAFVFEKSMICDDMTIHIHEIYMLNRFLMVPCFENHQFNEFLSFYFGKIGNFKKIQKCRKK